MDAADRDEFVDDENENQDAEAGDGSSGGRQSDAGPEKAAKTATTKPMVVIRMRRLCASMERSRRVRS
jgi:hypothetical protein